jgi:hypothetical protein
MKRWLWNLLKIYFISFFPYLIVFVISLYNPADSDLGWHLKYGEYFFKNHRILQENIFSTEIPGYKWVNSSWATDLVTYSLYDKGSFLGLSLVGALVVTLTFYFFSKAANLSFWEQAFLFPILAYLEQPLVIVSFRGHLLSLLSLGILYFLLARFMKGKRWWLYLAVPLFTLWSNFHGEFILGLGLFLVWILFYLRKNIFSTDGKLLFGIFVISALATLINPFSFGIYQETLRHFGNPFQQYVIEWLPFDTYSLLWWNLEGWGIFLAINIFILIKQKKFTKNLPYIVGTAILFALSLFIRRYTWPMFLVSLPLAKNILCLIKPKEEKLQFIVPAAIFLLFYLAILYVRNPLKDIKSMSWNTYCQRYVLCSPNSAQFLIDNGLTHNLLTFYGWGGWLIANYPQIKPSIDGRMHLWQDETGYSAFAYYYPLEQAWGNVDESKYDTVYMPPTKPIFKQMIKLVETGKWKILYQDKYAYIFSRKIDRN